MGSCGITAGLGHFGVAKVALRGLFGVSVGFGVQIWGQFVPFWGLCAIWGPNLGSIWAFLGLFGSKFGVILGLLGSLWDLGSKFGVNLSLFGSP